MNLRNHQLFVSYKREDLGKVKRIETLLRANGITVWRDLDYLPVGLDTEKEIKRAIFEECSGFLFYVTRHSLTSDFIWNIEIPAAFERSQQENGNFPIIPLFESPDLVAPFSERSFEKLGVDLSNRNGFILDHDNTYTSQILNMASRILNQLVAKAEFTPVQLFTYGTIPTCPPNHLTLDWTSFFDDKLNFEVWKTVLIPCLRNVKIALLRKINPQREVWLPSRIHLSAGLAYGWVFRRTTGFTFIPSESLKAENPEELIDPSLFESLTFDEYVGKHHSDNLCLGISIAKDVHPTINRMVQQGYDYKVNSVAVMSKPGPKAIINTSHARFLAEQTVDELVRVRNQFLTNKTDIILSSSVQYAAYLGWSLNACGDFTVWQFNNKTQTCTPAFDLDCVYDTDT